MKFYVQSVEGYKTLTLEMLERDTNPEYNRIKPLIYRAMYSAASKGQNTIKLVISRPDNLDAFDIAWEKLKTHFHLEGFKFFANSIGKKLEVNVTWV